MAQSLDVPVSSLMSFGLVGKSLLLQRYVLVSFCMCVLNSFGWNSFITGCPLLPHLRIIIVCTVQYHSIGIVFVGQPDLMQKFALNFSCFWTGYALYLCGLKSLLNCEF